MREIKYLSHNLRNLYLFTLFVISVNLIHGYQLSVISFCLYLFTYLLSYLPVYFLNDYADRFEDKKFDKANLFNTINSNLIFWITTILITLIGSLLTILISKIGFLLLLTLFILNYLYSFKPFRFRNKPIIRESLIFIIYIIKIIYLSNLIFSASFALPLPLLLMSATTGAFSVSLYKRHQSRNLTTEIIFGSIFCLTWFISLMLYKQTFFLFLPLLPVLVFLTLKYKSSQIPIGIYQTLYFLYTISIYFLLKQ